MARKNFLLLAAFFWFLIWINSARETVGERMGYYRFFLSNSFSTVRQQNTAYDAGSSDYYSMLRFCDQVLPPEAKIQLILAQDNLDKYFYLRERGRYFLYPRNFGNNTRQEEYILVYGVSGLAVPRGYRVCKVFSPDKYLLVKSR